MSLCMHKTHAHIYTPRPRQILTYIGLYHTWQFAFFLMDTSSFFPASIPLIPISTYTPQLGSQDNTLTCVLHYYFLYLGDIKLSPLPSLGCLLSFYVLQKWDHMTHSFAGLRSYSVKSSLRKILQVIFYDCPIFRDMNITQFIQPHDRHSLCFQLLATADGAVIPTFLISCTKENILNLQRLFSRAASW